MDRKQDKEAEIKFFNQIALLDRTEKLRPLIQLIMGKLEKFTLSGLMLECGCGTGKIGKWFLANFQKLYFVWAVDLSHLCVKKANNGNPNYLALTGDLEDKELFGEKWLDVVLCSSFLHHFPSINKVMGNIYYWLKPGGLLIVIDTNGSNPVNRLGEFLRNIIMRVAGKNFLIYNDIATPNETCHIPETYRRCAKNIGLKLLYEEGIFFMNNARGINQVKVNMFRLLRWLMPRALYSSPIVLMVFKKEGK